MNLIKKPEETRTDDNLDTVIDQIFLNGGEILDEELPEMFNNFEITEEQR